MENVNIRSFSWPTYTCQSLDFVYYKIDYWLRIYSSQGHYWDVNIRWAGGWGLMNQSINVHKALSAIVQSKPLKKKKQFDKLSTSPVVIFHEHESLEDGVSRMIFQKCTKNNTQVLLIRYVKWIEGILKRDFSVTLCNPHQALQRDLFDDSQYEELMEPIFVNQRDLDEISQFLLNIYKVQQKHYQKEVDRLLFILPSIS